MRRQTHVGTLLLLLALVCRAAAPASAAPPKVIEAEPANGDNNVDPELKLIRIEFDQDMSGGGFSICGGKNLKVAGKPRWASKRVFELPVELAPGTKYSFSVNCASAMNFKSAAGQPATVHPIAFQTKGAPAKPPKVVKADPDDGDEDVDAKLDRIRIEFDQNMSDSGYSICGGQGIDFSEKGRWVSPRVFEVPVKLEADKQYQLSVNCPSAQGFKSAAGVPAEVYPITFKTLAAGADPPRPLPVGLKRVAINNLRKAIDQSYSYRDLHKIDWDARFQEFTPRLMEANNWARFARTTAELLSVCQDPHVWLSLDDRAIGTFRREAESNFNAQQLPKLVPGWKLHNSTVATGRFDDGIGYILIATWSPQGQADLEPAFEALKEFADAPGIVLDVRANSGGAEPLAQKIAGCFLREKTAYARSAYRHPSAPGGFGQQYERTVEPNAEGPEVHAPVAVLMGNRCMSSCESFLMMMDQVPGATLIGETSYGSSGNPKPHKLGGPLVVYLPSWQDLALDGTLLEGKGVEPDVVVDTQPSDFAATDPVLEQALKHLRSQAGE
ncbi:MAG: hypothetical protein DWQ37_13435 [Planctomycetota bacterium]|nr:MAG: hypothetical protein DWQ37_13435 [Planctomycetota bacterium]